MPKMINPTLCDDGWLLGREGNQAKPAYISCLKVEPMSTIGDRTHFTVAEGPLKGDVGSILKTVNGQQTLVDVAHEPEALIFVRFTTAITADGKNHGLFWTRALSRRLRSPRDRLPQSTRKSLRRLLRATQLVR